MIKQALGSARDVWSGVLDLIYPPCCLVCGKAGDDYLCADCLEKIDTIGPRHCSKCGMPDDGMICLDCREIEYAFDSACSAGTFDGVLQTAIHKFKYRNHIVMADPLGDLLYRCFADAHLAGKVDVVIPVPIHKSRMVERGFNQSIELAKRFCKRTSLPLDTSILIKHRNTPHQVNLRQEIRLTNVRDAFTVVNAENVCGKRILLIDDVFTTGSTLHEAAKALKTAGASQVHAYTLARSL